jgi:predicted N-acyltransferase
LHVNFHDEQERMLLDSNWNTRHTVQFHWHNQNWPDFEAFSAALEPKKRKNIRQERAKVAAAGYTFRLVDGTQADSRDLTAMHHLYQRTFDAYGNAPALTLEFFQHLATQMPHAMLLILAERGGSIRAGALCLRSRDTLYGRYWGSLDESPGLHFETCYYQGIDYCLREGLQRFEPGAQGEHKIARGFLPVLTHSQHWLADADFAQAIRPWCAQECSAMHDYLHYTRTLSPYNRGSP